MSYPPTEQDPAARESQASRSDGSSENVFSDLPTTEAMYKSIARTFHPIYSLIFSGRQEFAKKTEEQLIKANRNETVETHISGYLGVGVLSGGLIGVLFGIMAVLNYTSAPTITSYFSDTSLLIWVVPILLESIVVFVVSIIGGMVAGGATALSAVRVFPRMEAKNRRTEINSLLPDAIAFMYCLSAGGMNRVDIIRVLADSEEQYGEVSVEFERVVHLMDNFSEDFHTAIEDVSETTPSEELREFLNDMLSVVTSGGRMDTFLESQFAEQKATVEQSQQERLDRLELMNEIYITLTLLPVMGLTLVAFAAALGIVGLPSLYIMTYIMIPTIQIVALIILSTAFEASYGTGRLSPDSEDKFSAVDDEQEKVLSAGLAKNYRGLSKKFDQIYISEIRSRLLSFFADPFQYIRQRPKYVFAVSVPVAVVFVIAAIITGHIQLSSGEMTGLGLATFDVTYIAENGFTLTLLLFYLPLLVILLPYVVFYELDKYRRGRITDGFTTALNKLANTNEQGIPLRQSMLITAEGHTSQLANEFETMYKKQEFGIPLGQAIIETNNKYRIPRLARLFQIMKSAQEVSNNINDVLITASELSEAQERLESNRITRTNQQVMIIGLIFLIFLAALLMMEGFIIQEIAEGQGTQEAGLDALGGGSEPVSDVVISLMFYHGAIIQGAMSGLISGYIRSGSVVPGLKYSLGYISIVMGVWFVF